MKPLSFKITSDYLLLCVFLSLLLGFTDSNTTSTPDSKRTTTVTRSTTTKITTTQTTTQTTKPPPGNVEKVQVLTQTETSITLEWGKVNNISTYLLRYNNGSDIEENITKTHPDGSVTHVVTSLTAGRKYSFTLLTVFEGVHSTGNTFTAVTAPSNAEEFKSTGQNETSITLQWKIVDEILDYTLLFNGYEKNITASATAENVTYTILGLTSGTKYNFSLFTVFENVTSSGENITAATAPGNVEEVQVLTQTETSITLEWGKVNNISTYLLQYNNGSDIEENITKTHPDGSVTHVVTSLTAGRKYNFTLLTVFEGVHSTGHTFTAVTAPGNVEKVQVLTQTETSITLEWGKVNNISTYLLQYNNGSDIEENITKTHPDGSVTHVVTSLTAGRKYDFSLFTVFEGVHSTGHTFTAVTAPSNAEEFKSIGQNETSITLQWKIVDEFLDYTLLFNGNEKNITASATAENVTYTIQNLISGTKYNFSLFTVFENVTSSGENITAATAPGNVEEVQLTQNESSITLIWHKVNNILTYLLRYNSGSDIEENITESNPDGSVTHVVTSLTAGTKYNFTLFTVFEGVHSTGHTFTAVTVPSMVTSVNVTKRSVNSITLEWDADVKKDWSYSLRINGETLTLAPERSRDVVSRTVSALQPGTEYPFSVITNFFGHNSMAYKDFTVTPINCTNEMWHVTNSSIQGTIEGLFTNATATNTSQTHVSPGGHNVSFTGLFPGATYEVTLMYEKNSRHFQQCNLNLTVIPPVLSAHCEYLGSGYSVLIVWNKPDGVWTEVEVNMTGKTYTVYDTEQQIIISGFLPARTYEVSVTSLSEDVRSYKPFVFSCSTDPRGVIAGSVFAVLLFVFLICLASFILLKRPDILSRKKSFIFGSKQSNKKCKAIPVAKFPDHFNQLTADEYLGFSQEYESFIPVGTEQTRREALAPENKERNRFNNVLPYDWCRVKLSTSSPIANYDYINANYMPGYNSNREYIATQGPLPSTVNDFWRMIWEQKAKAIIMVTNCTEGGRTKCERYWPADKDPCLYGELLITVTSEQQEPNWTLREFRVKNRNTAEERSVKHFHFTAWPDHGVPQGTEVLIQFRGLVRQHIKRAGSGAPTVVHCSAGVGRTGTIIALDVLLQQLEKEKAVDINGFVQKMRLSRPHMVQTESQYVFLHQCIMDCLQPKGKTEENIYENTDMIYANATALRELHSQA